MSKKQTKEDMDYERELQQHRRDLYDNDRRIQQIKKDYKESVPLENVRRAFHNMEKKYGRKFHGYDRDTTYYRIFVGSYNEKIFISDLRTASGIPLQVVGRIAKKYECNIYAFYNEDLSGGSGMGGGSREKYIKTIYHNKEVHDVAHKIHHTPDSLNKIKSSIVESNRGRRFVTCVYYAVDANDKEEEICKTKMKMNGGDIYDICDKFGVDIKTVYEYDEPSDFCPSGKHVEIYKFTGDGEI